MSETEPGNRVEKWIEEGREGPPPVHAATVILLREGGDGLETLMLRRNSKIVFGGMWVFPGGRVDPEDWEGVSHGDELAAARRTAQREAFEESGLRVDPDEMHPFSHWSPPPIAPKRFLTWFFAARAIGGEVVIDEGEIHDHAWLSPGEALRRQQAGEIELLPPTWVTLFELASFGGVEDALAAIQLRTPERFETHFSPAEDGAVALWHGDAGYEAGDAGIEGERHRLTMPKSGAWRYERSTKPSA